MWQDADVPPPPPPPPGRFQDFELDEPQADKGGEAPVAEWTRFTSRLAEEGFSLHFNSEANQYYYADEVSGECYWADEVEHENGDCNTDMDTQQLGADLSVPSVQSESTSLSQPSNVVERSASMMEQKQRKIDKLKKAQDERELQSIRSKPTLTKKSEGLSRSVSDMLAWEEQRRERLAAKIRSNTEMVDTQMTGRPAITKKAQLLRRDGPDDDSATVNSMSISSKSVQERLYDYDEVKRERMQRLHKLQDQAIRDAATPKIDERSARIARTNQQQFGDVSVHNRLYWMSHQGQLPADPHHGKLQQHDERTGQRLFAPKLNRTSEALARRSRSQEVAVEDLLQEKGQIYKQRLAVRERSRLQYEARLREKPKINSQSERLVNSRMSGERLEERLQKPIGNLKPRTLHNLPQHTFTPKISDSSKEILTRCGYRSYSPPRGSSGASQGSNVFYCDGQPSQGQSGYAVHSGSSSSSSGVGIYDRSLHWEQLKQKKVAREQEFRRNQEMQECSFRPNVKAHGAASYHHAGSVPIADRHAKWVQEREEKLQIQRRWRSDEELRDCTFVPKVEAPHLIPAHRHLTHEDLSATVRTCDSEFADPERELPQPPSQFALMNPEFYTSDFHELERFAQPARGPAPSDLYAQDRRGWGSYSADSSARLVEVYRRAAPDFAPPVSRVWESVSGSSKRYDEPAPFAASVAPPYGPSVCDDYEDDFSMSAAVELE